MSQGYKSRFEQMRENALQQSSQDNSVQSSQDHQYPSGGNGRNICFIWPDGKRLFLSYSYMVSGQYSPEESAIVLTFTTCTVTVKGSNLESLFDELMEQRTRLLECEDGRYSEVIYERKEIVNEIVVA
jgi:hypothetical protein